MYQGYGQQPVRAPQNYFSMQPQQTALKGRLVSSLEEVRATGIDFDGSVFYFPDIANKRIYTKQIGGSVSIGACDDDTKTIYISYEIPRRKLKKVLCHEITHAAMFSYNVDLSIQQEEILADLIATYGQEIVGITNCLNNRIRGTS